MVRHASFDKSGYELGVTPKSICVHVGIKIVITLNITLILKALDSVPKYHILEPLSSAEALFVQNSFSGIMGGGGGRGGGRETIEI